MTDKINGQGLRPSDTATARRSETLRAPAEQGDRRTNEADKTTSPGDTVNITASGLLMSRLEEAVQRTPVVDEARVAALKDAIAAGRYEINDQRTADKLVEFERDVLR